MTPEQAKAQIDLAQQAFESQRKMNQEVLDSQLDAGDRLILRKAADTVSTIAQVQALNPQ